MPSFAKALETWNRRLHYYLGLYFLFFLWLFSLTGLMLNHQQWFTDLYDRHQVSYDPEIRTPFGVTLYNSSGHDDVLVAVARLVEQAVGDRRLPALD